VRSGRTLAVLTASVVFAALTIATEGIASEARCIEPSSSLDDLAAYKLEVAEAYRECEEWPDDAYSERADRLVNWRDQRSMFGLLPAHLLRRESTAPAGSRLASRPRRREHRLPRKVLR
jgi:hypothetical protein